MSWPAGRSMSRVRAVAMIGLALGACVSTACSPGRSETVREPERKGAPDAPRVLIEKGARVVILDPVAQRASGIETATLVTATYREQLRAYGTVLDLRPFTELGNSYAAARAGRQTAQARLAASRSAFDRAQKLYDDEQNVSAAQLQAAEAAFRVDQAGAAAADSLVRALAATAQQAWGSTLARALIEGTPLFDRLITREDVLVQATLPPGVFLAKPPVTAFAELPGGSRAVLQFVSPATRTDPRIQGTSFFFTAPRQTGLLPEMNVLVSLASDIAVRGVFIPAPAVVWWQGRAWAYLQDGTDRFTRREIPVDLPTADGGYVVKTISAGTELVIQGAQMLLSEETRSGAGSGEGEGR